MSRPPRNPDLNAEGAWAKTHPGYSELRFPVLATWPSMAKDYYIHHIKVNSVYLGSLQLLSTCSPIRQDPLLYAQLFQRVFPHELLH